MLELASQSNLRLHRSNISRLLHSIWSIAGLDRQKWALAVDFVSVNKMRHLNHRYRGKQRPTDILSFKLNDYSPVQFSFPLEDCKEEPLGHLFLCIPYVKRRLRFRERPDMRCLDMRLERLLVHGTCHLMGYDHETWNDYSTMFRQECRILRALYKFKIFRRNKASSQYL